MGTQTLHEIVLRHGPQLVHLGVEVQPLSTE